MNELVKIEINWYYNLIQDIQLLESTGIVATKHAIGKRILDDFEKFGKPEYGEKRIENIAKDCSVSNTEIKKCIRFARLYPQLGDSVSQLGWRKIYRELLIENPRKPHISAFPNKKYGIIYADPAWKYYEGGYKNQEQIAEKVGLSQDRISQIIRQIENFQLIVQSYETEEEEGIIITSQAVFNEIKKPHVFYNSASILCDLPIKLLAKK